MAKQTTRRKAAHGSGKGSGARGQGPEMKDPAPPKSSASAEVQKAPGVPHPVTGVQVQTMEVRQAPPPPDTSAAATVSAGPPNPAMGETATSAEIIGASPPKLVSYIPIEIPLVAGLDGGYVTRDVRVELTPKQADFAKRGLLGARAIGATCTLGNNPEKLVENLAHFFRYLIDQGIAEEERRQ